MASLAYGPNVALGGEIKLTLAGDQEIPPVATAASGVGVISIGADRSISGSLTLSGMSATVVHIHEAAAGKNGSIVIPLEKVSDDAWRIPPGTKLSDAQYDAYKAGNLYLNVHSAAHKTGEIRGQIKPD